MYLVLVRGLGVVRLDLAPVLHQLGHPRLVPLVVSSLSLDKKNSLNMKRNGLTRRKIDNDKPSYIIKYALEALI